ncbi:DUF6520 family protein [Gelidibacter maritimus]|uniref:Secreted protein n=1 Tax=Gelidibacter maritimus TaxID=2761487 RepID=A0A7W2M4S4_9FLAO|nr:DUF6520 family protein [Gelidibacter maritimus]MBA6152707.1 hypothetical protein [Gelidibacter maritimus]
MKSKFLKLGMPFTVFMMAIVFAFASEKTTTENESLRVTNYIMQDDFCVSSTKECNDIGSIPCTDDLNRQVHDLKFSDTVCDTALFHYPF